MKILYLVSNHLLNPNANTGYGRHIRETIAGLERIGHQVKVVTVLKTDEVTIEKSEASDNRNRRVLVVKRLLPSLIWETVKDIRQLLGDRTFRKVVSRTIDEYNPDLIYERTCYLSNVVAVNSKYKLRWVLEVNAPFVEQRKKISGSSLFLSYAHRMERFKYSRATHVFCVSGVLADFIKNKYLVDRAKVSVNHNGVNPSDFQGSLNTVIDKSFLTFGFVGSIMPYHGIEMLIAAFIPVIQKYPASKLLIVGDGQILGELKELCDRNGIRENVFFTGGIAFSEVGNKISQMDVCILPNTAWYCSPIKLFEYGILGKPIIAPSENAVKELIVNGMDGLLVDGEKSLTQEMIKLIEQPDLRKKTGINFQKRVLASYTWEKNVERINEVIVSL